MISSVREYSIAVASSFETPASQAPQDEVCDPHGEERGNGARLEPRGHWIGFVARTIEQRGADEKVDARHSGAMRSIEPGISRFPDVQLHI
jgi:hypothetical protein